MSTTTNLGTQYKSSDKLAARARLHQEFSVAEVPWFSWVAQRLGLAEGSKVLDIGCGPGWFWAASADVLPDRIDLSLADLSPGMVEEAVNRCTPLRNWRVDGGAADAAHLPYADESFDVVVAMHMLYHVADPAVAIAEMYRVLKPGGTLAVTTNGAGNLRQLYALTTVFGVPPVEPVAAIFGFEIAERLLGAQFGAVERHVHPASLRVTDPEVVFMALTSYPPGDGAPEAQLAAFREAIAAAFATGDGVLEVEKETALFLCRKAG